MYLFTEPRARDLRLITLPLTLKRLYFAPKMESKFTRDRDIIFTSNRNLSCDYDYEIASLRRNLAYGSEPILKCVSYNFYKNNVLHVTPKK